MRNSIILVIVCLSFIFTFTKSASTELEHGKKQTHQRKKPTRSTRITNSVFESKGHKKQSKACTLELEKLLFSPSSTVQNYMAKIAKEMRADIQVIMSSFAGGSLEYIRSYAVKFGIKITIFGPLGQPVLVTSDSTVYTSYVQNVAMAQTYLNRDGFFTASASDVSTGYYDYQFTLRSTDGQLLTFALSLPLSAMPNFPV